MGGVTGVKVPSDQAFKLVQELLTEVYRDTDGRTVLRELVQNADDAGARRIEFGLHAGLQSSEHPFLRGPALIVANDGSFCRRDEEAMHQSAGGSKSTDVEKVGRFGLGQKSVFHLCETFYYVGFSPEDGLIRGGVDPWLADGQVGASAVRNGFDPNHPSSEELAILDPVRRQVLQQESESGSGLMLWIPLRQEWQSGRDEAGRSLPLSTAQWTLPEAAMWLDSKRVASFAMLLAQAGSLESICTVDEHGRALVRVERRGGAFQRPSAHEPHRRYVTRAPTSVGPTGTELSVTTIAVVDSQHEELQRLRAHPSWPSDYFRSETGLRSERRKAAGHAAVTLLQRSDPSIVARWAVFFPLNDDPEPGQDAANTFRLGRASGKGWDIILHGYFLPTRDRQSVPGAAGAGLTDPISDRENEERLRERWNRTLRDRLLLPLVPQAVEKATEALEATEIGSLVSALRLLSDRVFAGDAMWATDYFLPVATAEGCEWRRLPASFSLRDVAAWTSAPGLLREAWVPLFPEGLVVLDGGQPRLSRDPVAWTPDEVKRLLDAVPARALDTVGALQWLDAWLRGVKTEAAPGDQLEHDRVLAYWWQGRLANGDIPDTVGSGARKLEVEVLQQRWRALLIERSGLVPIDVPRGTRRACQELASASPKGGHEIVLLPFGVPKEGALKPDDATVLRPSLEILGRAIAANLDRSSAQLRLADALVGFLDSADVVGALRSLPLVRGREHGKTVEPRDVPLTVADIERARSADKLLFRRDQRHLDDEEEDSPQGVELKGVASLLAKVVGARVVLVRWSALTENLDLDNLTLETIETAISERTSLSHVDSDRVELLAKLLTPDRKCSADVIRALATGWSVEEVASRTLLETTSIERPLIAAVLRRLGRSRDLVPELVSARFSPALLKTAGFVPADLGYLANHLAETVGAVGEACEPFSEDEAEQLLKELPPESVAWKQLPLHRRWSDGARVPLPSDAALAGSGFSPPEGLGVSELLVDPRPETRDRYTRLPLANRSWLVERVLQRSGENGATDLLVGQDPRGLSDVAAKALRTTAWLPTGSGTPAFVAPDQVLFFTDSGRSERSAWQTSVIAVREAGGIRDVEFENELKLTEIQLEALRKRWARSALEDIEFVLSCLRPGAPGEAEWRVLPNRQLWDAHKSVLGKLDLRRCGVGWAFVASVMPLLSEVDKERILERLIPNLVGAMTAKAMVGLLRVVEETYTGLKSPEGELYVALLEASHTHPDFSEKVLPKLEKLMTAAGQRAKPADIARVSEGVAPSNLLALPLRTAMGLDSSHVPQRRAGALTGEPLTDKSSTQALVRYFEEAINYVRKKPVACFLNLLLDENLPGVEKVKLERSELLERWSDGQVDTYQRECRREIWGNYVQPIVIEPGFLGDGDLIEHENLLGELRPFRTVSEGSVLAGPPVWSGGAWRVRLRKANWPSMTPEDRKLWIEAGARTLSSTLPWLAPEKFAVFWSSYAEGSQETLQPARNLIRDELRSMLVQLRLGQSPHFKELIRKIAADVGQARKLEKIQELKKELEAKLSDGAAQQEVLEAVRKRISQSSYSPESALFELFQNADDAYLDLKSTSGSFHVLLRGHSGLDVRHWGRKINDTLGRKDTDWGYDLHAMLCAGLTAKTDDAGPGGAAPTGRFGLGFKAVYFLTDSPRIRSGELTLRVVAGLLPERVESMSDFPDVDDRPLQCTQLVLPPATDEHVDAQGKAFDAFRKRTTMLVAFAQRIRRIRLGSEPDFAFSDEGIDSASTWTMQGPHLRWRPTALSDSTGAALLIPLEGRFDDDVPTLWNVTPTREKWNLGYCINARFKLDPGRTRAEIDHHETTRLLRQLGDQLGRDLCQLHDCWSDSRARDLQTLWDRLSSGLSQADQNRQRFLRTLHGRGEDDRYRGLARWAQERSIVPTGLSSPWAMVLPALQPSATRQIRRIDGALLHADVLSALCESAASLPLLVNPGTAETLGSLRFDELRPIKAVECLEFLAREDVEVHVARRLAGIAKEAVWTRLKTDEGDALERWRLKLRLKSETGRFTAIRELLLSHGTTSSPTSSDDDVVEEIRRARLAPTESRLDRGYDNAELFRKLRGPLHAKAERIVDWLEAGRASTEHVMDYVQEGRLRFEVLREVRRRRQASVGVPIPWAADLSAFRSTFGTRLVEQEHLLFLEQFVESSNNADTDSETASAPVSLEALWRSWEDRSYRERRLGDWHDLLYPRRWSRDRLYNALRTEGHPDEREAWLLLLTLSLCMRFRNRPEQSRCALESWMDREYWRDIVAASRPDEWTSLMDRMADERGDGDTKYLTWFGLLPHIYVASRWYDDIRADLRTIFREDWRPQHYLEPRSNPVHSGGGPDAPSISWARRCRHWVIRELSRLGLVQIHPRHARYGFYGGAPVARAVMLPEDSKSSDIHAHVARQLDPNRATFHGCFDIPLYLEGYGPTSNGAATGGKVDR